MNEARMTPEQMIAILQRWQDNGSTEFEDGWVCIHAPKAVESEGTKSCSILAPNLPTAVAMLLGLIKVGESL